MALAVAPKSLAAFSTAGPAFPNPPALSRFAVNCASVRSLANFSASALNTSGAAAITLASMHWLTASSMVTGMSGTFHSEGGAHGRDGVAQRGGRFEIPMGVSSQSFAEEIADGP